jgi:hypothetical protein
MEFRILQLSQAIKSWRLLAPLLMLVLSSSGLAQTLDKAKLDQFLDRLDEKNKAISATARSTKPKRSR